MLYYEGSEVKYMGVRDKLKSIKIRLNELAIYLNVSRPTLYKYLELYENQ